MILKTRLAKLEAQTRAPTAGPDPRVSAALAALSEADMEVLAAMAERGYGPVDDREHQAIAAYEAALEVQE
jgi:hypothetical protein